MRSRVVSFCSLCAETERLQGFLDNVIVKVIVFWNRVERSERLTGGSFQVMSLHRGWERTGPVCV